MSNAVVPWRNWYHCMGNTYGTWLPGNARGFRVRHHREHVEGDYRFPPPPGFYEVLLASVRESMPRGQVVIPTDLRPMACRLFGEALRFHGVELVELSMGGVHWHLLARFVPVGVDPYDHLAARGIKLTHARKSHRRSVERPPAPAGGNEGSTRDVPPAERVGVRGGRSRLSAYDHDPAPRRIIALAKTYVSTQMKKRGHFAHHCGGLWGLRSQCVPVTSRDHQIAVASYIRRHAEHGSTLWSPLVAMCGPV